MAETLNPKDSVFGAFDDNAVKEKNEGYTGMFINNETGTEMIKGGLSKIKQSATNLKQDFDKLNKNLSSPQQSSINNLFNSLADNCKRLENMLNNDSANDDFVRDFEQTAQMAQDLVTRVTEIENSFAQQKNTLPNAQELEIQTQKVREGAQILSNLVHDNVVASSQLVQSMSNINQSMAQTTQQVGQAGAQMGQVYDQATNNMQKFGEAFNQMGVKAEEQNQMFQDVLNDLMQRSGKLNELKSVLEASIEDTTKYADAHMAEVLGQLKAQLDENLDDKSAEGALSQLTDIVTKGINNITLFTDTYKNMGSGSMAIYKESLAGIRRAQESHIQIVKSFENVISADNKDGKYDDIISKLQAEQQRIVDTANTSLKQITEAQNQAIKTAIQEASNRQLQSTQKGTPAYDAVTKQIMNNQMNGIGYNTLIAGADEAIMHLESSRGKNSPWYQYITTGNLLGNKTNLANNLRTTQRNAYTANQAHSMLIDAIKDDNLSSAQKAEYIGKLQIAHKPLIDSIKNTANGMHLSMGGGKALTEEDKKVFNAFKSQVDEALSNLQKSINAIETHDPHDATLKQLREEQKVLQDIKDKAEKASESSSALSNVFSTMWSGLKKLKNILAGGLGLLGLGSILSPLAMLKGGINQEENEGKRRYNTARVDAYMGANFNQARILDIADKEANKYWRMTNGMINEDEFVNYYSTMAHVSGGHYGESANQAAADMQKISKDTFAASQVYGLSANSSANFFKTFYKDAGMSAQAASQALIDVAQTAQSANIPVEKYVQTITQMANALRSQGVTATQVKASMNNLVQRGMRVEDAQRVVGDVANMNANMASDQNSSAFWGMMAGQGGNPFDLIAQGYKSHDANGDPIDGYYQMMAQRVMTEAGFMSQIGGGAGSPMGSVMMIDSLMKRGASRATASQFADAAEKGDMSLMTDALQKAEKEKDGGKLELAEAASLATAKLKQAGNQVSVFQKMSTDITEAQKEIGHAIRDYLSGPLEKFRKGFGTILDTMVDWSGKLIKAVVGLMDGNSPISPALSWMGEHPLATLAGATVGVGALIGGKKWIGGKIANAITNSSRIQGAKGAVGKFMSKGGTAFNVGTGLTALAAGGAIAGGFFALNKLVSMFQSGEAKATIAQEGNNDQAKIDSVMADFYSYQDAPEYKINGNGFSDYDKQVMEQSLYENGWYSQTAWNHMLEDGTYNREQLMKEVNEEWNQSDKKAEIDQHKINDGTYNDKSEYAGQFGLMSGVGGLMAYQALKYGGKVGWNKLRGNSNVAFHRDNYKVRQNLQNLKTLGRMASYEGFNPRKTFGVLKGLEETKELKTNMFRNFKGFAKGLGGIGTALTIGSDIYGEYQNYQANPDTFNTNHAIGRTLLSSGGAILGGALGGLAGSVLGPLGTFAGGAIGASLGGMAGRGMANLLGISAEDDAKTVKDKYDKRKGESEELFHGSSILFCDSNNENKRAVDKALDDHGIQVQDVTHEEERFMNDLYEKLKAKGFDDQMAAFLAASQIGVTKQDAKSAIDNNKNELGEALRDMGRHGIEGEGNPVKAEGFASNPYNASSYLYGTLYGTQYDSTEKATAIDEYLDGIKIAYNKNDRTDLLKFISIAKSSGVLEKYDKYEDYSDGKLAQLKTKYKEYFRDNNTADTLGDGEIDALAEYMASLDYSRDEQSSGMFGDIASAGAHYFKEQNRDILTDQIAKNMRDRKGTAPEQAEQMAKQILGGNIDASGVNATAIGKRQKLAEWAKKQLDKPYVWGGEGPDGYDCSGLTLAGTREVGLQGLDHNAANQASFFKSKNALKKSWKDAAMGDLIYFDWDHDGSADHTGIYMGDGKMIHAHGGKNNPDKVKWEDLNNYTSDANILGVGDLSAMGAEAGSPSGAGSDGLGSQETPEEVIKAHDKLMAGQMAQMGEFAGLKDKELLHDRVATGRLIFDGTTALSANGNYLSLRGARDNFRLNSGVHDRDLFGVGIHGAYSGDGTMKTGTGVHDITNRLEKTLGLGKGQSHTYQLNGFEEQQKIVAEVDAIAAQNKEAHQAQLETYQKAQEAQQKAVDKIDKSKQTAKIAITVIGNNGEQKRIHVTEEELKAIIAQQNATIERLEQVIHEATRQ